MVKKSLRVAKSFGKFKAIIIEDRVEDIANYYAEAFGHYIDRFEFSWLAEVGDTNPNADLQNIRAIAGVGKAATTFKPWLEEIWGIFGKPPNSRLLSADSGILNPLDETSPFELEYNLEPKNQLRLAKSIVKKLLEEKWHLVIIDKQIDRISRAPYSRKYKDPNATIRAWSGTELLVEYMKASHHFPEFIIFSVQGMVAHGVDKRNHPEFITGSDEWRYVDKGREDWIAQGSSLEKAMDRIEATLRGNPAGLKIGELAKSHCIDLKTQYEKPSSEGHTYFNINDKLPRIRSKKNDLNGRVFRLVLGFSYAYLRDKLNSEPQHIDLCQFLLPKKYRSFPDRTRFESTDNSLKQCMNFVRLDLGKIQLGKFYDDEVIWLRRICASLEIEIPPQFNIGYVGKPSY
jgi:hypothetical protein